MLAFAKEKAWGQAGQSNYTRQWFSFLPKGTSEGHKVHPSFSYSYRHPLHHRVYPVVQGPPLLISSSTSSLLVCLPTEQFLDGAGGNKPHYLGVCIGRALESSQSERDLGCGSAWLPVTVKCFLVWKHRSHLSRQVHRLKWLPVWKCFLSISSQSP